MTIRSGDTSRKVGFLAVDSTDLKTAETGLSSGWSVYYSLDGGAATAMTTPTVAELDATNMPGVYSLAIDEAAMVADPGLEALTSAELILYITHAGVAPITRTIEVVNHTIEFQDGTSADVEDCLRAMWVQGFGDWKIHTAAGGAVTWRAYGPGRYTSDDTAVCKPEMIWNLDSATGPTERVAVASYPYDYYEY